MEIRVTKAITDQQIQSIRTHLVGPVRADHKHDLQSCFARIEEDAVIKDRLRRERDMAIELLHEVPPSVRVDCFLESLNKPRPKDTDVVLSAEEVEIISHWVKHGMAAHNEFDHERYSKLEEKLGWR